ncbi:uncharacterized protein LOC114316078 [Camellia sinensis]|uniref:uncharacterized protein LOC114316078 n=1 Tax=Camellia sinensis TaxID=4442 RepID=UPI00103690C3|nr:uncharacterized protein LOC114316078 [Camellia sinensis]
MSRKRAEDMKWFTEKRLDDGVLRHPADSDEWKEFDSQHPKFALEPGNMRPGLATDGFNPFENMNNSYRIDIDVYMRPFVDELNELWTTGTLSYDASTGETFCMRSALLRTIHDWPAFSDMSGWRTKGHYSCYTCNDEPYFESLRSNTTYNSHRCYLPDDHPERQKSRAYNGKHEKWKRSLVIPIEKIEEQLGSVTGVTYGKHPSNMKRPRQNPNWTKVSILYELPYWKKKRLRHNIDVMHMEKNFSENVIRTMLGIDGKNKDTDKARMDLEDMNIRKELWLIKNPDGSYVKPRACFSLTPKEREGFFEFLKSIKYPDGYAANISRSVNAKNGKLTGLKSYDCRVLIQRILPIGMRGYIEKEISTTLFELGSLFQDLCSRTLKRSEMEKLEECIVLILCKFEKIFPPAFFNVMVHLAIHLPREIILGGPVQYRWMYPIERFLGALKKCVNNQARPEGSIAKAYIVNECITFCSMYLEGIETVRNRDARNEDYGVRRQGLTIFTETARPIGQIRKHVEMSQELRDISHWFLLYNNPEIEKYLQEQKNLLQISTGQDITQIQQKEFPKWFKEYINRLRVDEAPEGTEELCSLANGPNLLVKEYSGCIINGVRFHTKELDNRCKSQNSGVLTKGDNKGEMHEFYGHLCNIWEFEDDIEAEVIPNKTKRDGRDDEEDEELGILDDDMEPDMDYDI